MADADILLIGNSHVNALYAGCIYEGIKCYELSAGDAAWLEGKFAFDRWDGLTADSGRPQKKLADLLERMGRKSIFDLGLPVIGLFGFHLDKLLAHYGSQLIMSADGRAGDPSKEYVSRASAFTHVENVCKNSFQIIESIAEMYDLTMVVPPRTDSSHNRQQLVEILTDLMSQRGATVFDLNLLITNDKRKKLPRRYIAKDGFHGTDEFGAMAIKKLFNLDLE